jgi:hypothetical protein
VQNYHYNGLPQRHRRRPYRICRQKPTSAPKTAQVFTIHQQPAKFHTTVHTPVTDIHNSQSRADSSRHKHKRVRCCTAQPTVPTPHQLNICVRATALLRLQAYCMQPADRSQSVQNWAQFHDSSAERHRGTSAQRGNHPHQRSAASNCRISPPATQGTRHTSKEMLPVVRSHPTTIIPASLHSKDLSTPVNTLND